MENVLGMLENITLLQSKAINRGKEKAKALGFNYENIWAKKIEFEKGWVNITLEEINEHKKKDWFCVMLQSEEIEMSDNEWDTHKLTFKKINI